MIGYLSTSRVSCYLKASLGPFCLLLLILKNRNYNNVVFNSNLKHSGKKKNCKQNILLTVPAPKLATHSLIYPHWVTPISGKYKLNTDGSSLGNEGLVSGGGAIRDCNGRWVVGFMR